MHQDICMISACCPVNKCMATTKSLNAGVVIFEE